MAAAAYTETSAKSGLIRHGRKFVSPWDHPEVAAQVVEIREGAKKRAQITTADIVQRLEDARIGAMEDGRYSAAVSATTGIAKVLGLIPDRRRFEGIRPISEMTEDELESFIRQNGLEEELSERDRLYDDLDNFPWRLVCTFSTACRAEPVGRLRRPAPRTACGLTAA